MLNTSQILSAPHTPQKAIDAGQIAQIPLGNILREAAALAKTGMKRTTFRNLQDPKSPYFDPTAPAKIKLSLRSVGWSENELDAWLLARKKATPEVK